MENPANERIEIRVTKDSKKKYIEAAEKSKKSLSSWLKYLADTNS